MLLLNSLKSIIIIIVVLASRGICAGQEMMKYYGVDDIQPAEFSFLKDSLGGNFAMIELSTDSLAWKEALELAEKNDIKLVIWPLGDGHQWTSWAWNDTSWDISQGLDVMKYAEQYIISGGENLVAVVMSHEPFYNNGDPFTASEMKLLYSALKNVAPHVNLFVYMNDMAYYDNRPGTEIEDGLMDIAGIWLHCFGGAEGSWNDALEEIDDDRALVQEKGLNMQLFFALQSFGIAGTRYKMPSAADMLDFATPVFQKNKLDGIFWYPWDRVASSYTSYLSHDRYDNEGNDRWAVVRQLSPCLPAVGIRESETEAPGYSLSQNYPNPFFHSTTIEFTVPEPGLYTIKVYTILGQPVATLFDRVVTPGTYKVDYNAESLPAGPYLYTLQDNNSITTRIMILK